MALPIPITIIPVTSFICEVSLYILYQDTVTLIMIQVHPLYDRCFCSTTIPGWFASGDGGL